MTPFRFARAADTADALRLAAGPASAYLGGGTNLVDLMRETVATPGSLPTVLVSRPTPRRKSRSVEDE